MKPKITGVRYGVCSEEVFSWTKGPEDYLRYRSIVAFHKLMRSIGRNARGQFRFYIEFVPESGDAK